jgi:hypothetical protein
VGSVSLAAEESTKYRVQRRIEIILTVGRSSRKLLRRRVLWVGQSLMRNDRRILHPGGSLASRRLSRSRDLAQRQLIKGHELVRGLGIENGDLDSGVVLLSLSSLSRLVSLSIIERSSIECLGRVLLAVLRHAALAGL